MLRRSNRPIDFRLAALMNLANNGVVDRAPGGKFPAGFARNELSANEVTDIGNLVFTAFFCIEAVLKLVAYGPSYFNNGWNDFDFICVIASVADALLDLAGMATLFRVLRVLRVVKIARGLVALRQMFETILVRY